MIAIFLRFAVIMLVLRALPSLAWECEVTVDGPKAVKLNEHVTLTATGTPEGGHYSWSRIPNLIANGPVATLEGFKPAYSEYIRVIGYYTTPKGKTCSCKKYLWVCLCDVSIQDNAPEEAKVGEEIFLSATGGDDDGTYLWSLSKGSGSIKGNGSTAIFVGDRAGEVEIKVAYTPPDGGEPCKDFHTIQVKEECSIEIAGYPDVAIGDHIELKASGLPAGGSYEWLYAEGLLAMGDDAFFTGTNPGQTAITVKYITPSGKTCSGSHIITAYKIENITPRTACFDSGTVISRSDFQLLTSPPGYEDRISFVPETVSTLLQTEHLEVIGTIAEGTRDDVAADITVVNSDVKNTKSIAVNIPDVISDALGMFGASDQIKFNFTHSYSSFAECCDHGADTSTIGQTKLNINVNFVGKTIYGVPIYAPMKEYITIDLLQLTLSGGGSASINGKYRSCEQTIQWSGQGNFDIDFSLSSKAKANLKRYLVLLGTVAGQTNLQEKVTISNNQLICSGGWNGIQLTGTVVVLVSDFELLSDNVEYEIVHAKTISDFHSELPSLH